MSHRLAKPADPVTFTHDGASVVAERGEPIALSLLAAGRVPIARSAKLHRPRGPWCLRGACDGCLARVDGAPNVMTCRHAVRGGEVVETQNVIGSRSLDVLRATDFLFPKGIDHHHLLAGVSGVSQVVQGLARRIAGFGRLPDAVQAPRAAERREVDALVIGAGAAGLAAASELGARAWVVDDAPAPGGTLALVDPPSAADLIARARSSGATFAGSTTALALFREPPHADERRERPEQVRDGEERAEGRGARKGPRIHALLAGPDGITLALARAVIVAAGAQDTPPAFGNNDLPGVMSARAGLRMWRAGIAPGRRVVVAGAGTAADAFEREAAATIEVIRVETASLLRATGRSSLRALVLDDYGKERRIDVDALLIDGPRAPSFELLVQAGARVTFAPEIGYLPALDDDLLAAPRLWCAGEIAGTARNSAEDGARVGRAVRAAM